MTAVVRRATTSDIDDLLRLRVVMWTSLGEPEPLPGEWSNQAVSDLQARLPETDGDLAVFVADDEEFGQPVSAAFGVIHRTLPTPSRPDGRVGYVFDVVTQPEYRGQGLATAVMTELVAWFRSKGVARVELRATEQGARVYEKLGFTRYEEGQYSITLERD